MNETDRKAKYEIPADEQWEERMNWVKKKVKETERGMWEKEV